MLVADAATETAGVSVLFTVIITGAEVAVAGEAHNSVEVMTQVISSPSLSAASL